MNALSRTITGSVMLILGLILIIIPIFIEGKSSFFIWIYGIPILIISLFILFNEKEDSIEQRKDIKKKNN